LKLNAEKSSGSCIAVYYYCITWHFWNWSTKYQKKLMVNFTQSVFFWILSKASHTIDHSILLDNLFTYGIRGLSTIIKAMCQRGLSVYVNNVSFQHSPVRCGVPQCSILGPLLSIYI